MGNQEFTTQRHRQHWTQNTERRRTKHKSHHNKLKRGAQKHLE